MGDPEKEVAQQVEREHHSSSNDDINVSHIKTDGTTSDVESHPELTWTEEEEKAIRRKIDIHTVPLVTLLYMLCFLDRANIGNARIQGLEKDLALDPAKFHFNWALSIFYIVYLLVEVPSNIILKRVGPKFYLPFLVCGFGFISLCTSFVQSFPGLLVARAFLGIFEGGAMPGMAFFLSCFYKRNELLFRIGIYVSAASIAGAFGGLLASGLVQIPAWGIASMRIHTWRNIFFFEGLVTMIIGLLAPLGMPTKPSEAYFLTPRERLIAAERLVREHKADPDDNVTLADMKRAVFCIHNYTCALGFFLINITVQGLSVFMPTILKDMYPANTPIQAQLYSVPPYVCACLVAVLIAYLSDKTKQRGIWLASFSVLALIGFAILRWETTPNIRYMALYFVTIGAFPGGPGFLSWAMNNSAGPAVRAVTTAYVVTLGTLGGIVATWTYIPTDGPRYATGHTINLCGQIATILLAIFGILYCVRENRLRAAGKRDHRLEGLTEREQEALGNHHPRYRYWT